VPLRTTVLVLLALMAAAGPAAGEVVGGLLSDRLDVRGFLVLESSWGGFGEDPLFNPDGELLEGADGAGLLQIDTALRVDLGADWYVQSNLSGRLRETDGTDVDTTARELFVHGGLGPVDLTAGRRIVRWSNGYAFTPGGLLDPVRDPTDPGDRLNQINGRDLVQLDAYRSDQSFSLVYASDSLSGGDRDVLALRYGLLLGSLDLAVMGAWQPDGRDALAASAGFVLGDALGLHLEVAGGRGSEALFPRTVASGEPLQLYGRDYLASFKQGEDRIFWEYLLGVNYTFDNGFNIIAELFHSDHGLDAREWDRFLEHARFSRDLLEAPGYGPVDGDRTLPQINVLQALQSLEQSRVRQDYLFLRFVPPSGSRRITGSLVLLVDLEGGSTVVVPEINATLGRRVEGWLRFRAFAGPDDSHYGALPLEPTVNLGARVHW
jgi:hypothetical protein